MASSGITWDSVVKAGSDMMDIASASLQRTMKIQEVTATKDNDSQPAYALNELVQWCNKNSEEARAIAAALLRRASSSNPVIKWKALRAIRYICQNASTTQFKKACGGPQASVIREAISWSGPPHPQLGNALNLRVREAAKETLDEVFRVSAASSAGAPSATGTSLQGRIQGYGSTTGGKIQGAAAPGVSGTSSGGFTTGGAATGTGGKKYGGISSDDYFAGNSRGRWQTWSDASQSGLGTNGSTSTTGGSTTPPRAAAGSTAGTSAARAAIGTEEAVVDELCRGSGGVQPRPTPEALRSFVAKASQLDAEVIALELTHKLFNTTWQVRVRALEGMHAIAEAVKARGGGHPLEATTESLRSVTEAFAGVLSHENAAVRAAAGRVMRALGVESDVAAAVAAAQPPAAQAAAAAGGDLLGGFGDEGDGDAVAAEPAAAAAAAPAAQDMDDLLGGLDDGAGAAAAPSAAPPDDLGGLDALDDLAGFGMGGTVAPVAASPATAAPPTLGSAGVSDMFAGLTVSGAGPGGPAAAAAAAPAAAVDPLESLLGGLSDAPAPGAPPAANGNSSIAAAGMPPAAGAGLDPLAGLGDMGLGSLMSAPAPVAAPTPAAQTGAGAGVIPGTADMGMHGMHALPNGTGQFGAQPPGVPPGVAGAPPAPGMHFGGMQPGVGYAGVGGQAAYGMQQGGGGWSGQAGLMGAQAGLQPGVMAGQHMHGMPAPAAHAAGAMAGGGMGLPQGSAGAPVSQHSFAHAKGSLGGHKDAFDFVNDVIKKPSM